MEYTLLKIPPIEHKVLDFFLCAPTDVPSFLYVPFSMENILR